MAKSRLPGPIGLEYDFSGVLSSRTPGSLGLNDAADPSVLAYLGHTPGPLGFNDASEPSSFFSTGSTSIKGRVISPICFTTEINRKSSAKHLSISSKGLTLLKQIEKLHLKPYDDQTGQQIATWIQGATIGYGHLIKKTEWHTYKNGMAESQANILFEADLSPFVTAVQNGVSAQLSQNEFDALVILAFNIGVQSFTGSSVLKLINTPTATTKYRDLEEAWKAWNKSQGKVMKGLNNRRNCEWKIYSESIYERW
jgi:type VI secretion system secreted protein VgrG